MTSPFAAAWLDRFKDLPLLPGKPSKMDDSDIAFESDMAYCRDLLHDIHMQAINGAPVEPFPIILTDELDHALIQLAGIKSWIQEMSRA